MPKTIDHVAGDTEVIRCDQEVVLIDDDYLACTSSHVVGVKREHKDRVVDHSELLNDLQAQLLSELYNSHFLPHHTEVLGDEALNPCLPRPGG